MSLRLFALPIQVDWIQVGRHHFRQFLFSVHAEENLRFWEAVIEFKTLADGSAAQTNVGRTIQHQYLREGSPTEVSILVRKKSLTQSIYFTGLFAVWY